MEFCNAEMLLTTPTETFKIRLKALSLLQQISYIFSTDGSEECGTERMTPRNGDTGKHTGGHLGKIRFVLEHLIMSVVLCQEQETLQNEKFLLSVGYQSRAKGSSQRATLAKWIVFFWGKDIFRPKFCGSARTSQLWRHRRFVCCGRSQIELFFSLAEAKIQGNILPIIFNLEYVSGGCQRSILKMTVRPHSKCDTKSIVIWCFVKVLVWVRKTQQMCFTVRCV